MTGDLAFLTDYVLNAVANDYENLDQISIDASRWAQEDNRTFSQEMLVRAISGLVTDGLVNCYKFSPSLGTYKHCEFDAEIASDLWYLITNAGKKHPAVN